MDQNRDDEDDDLEKPRSAPLSTREFQVAGNSRAREHDRDTQESGQEAESPNGNKPKKPR